MYILMYIFFINMPALIRPDLRYMQSDIYGWLVSNFLVPLIYCPKSLVQF